MEIEEGEIVLCTVEKILGTTVFCKIEENGEGTLTTSEISPGRIRNLRDYVVPGKKIVCKVLKIQGDRIHLSLRRVKQNEKKELLDKIAKENSYKAIIKTTFGKENFNNILTRINEKYTLLEFFEKIKQNPEILENYFNKTETEKIIKILESKKEKPKEIKQKFKLSNKSSQGINIIKQIISEACKNSKCNISYLSAGNYNLSISGEDFKKIKIETNQIFRIIEKLAKKNDCEFSLEK